MELIFGIYVYRGLKVAAFESTQLQLLVRNLLEPIVISQNLKNLGHPLKFACC